MNAKILLLGGTSEGRELAHKIDQQFGDTVHLISSLAGRTKNAAKIPGEVRIGGFGGAPGLTDYLKGENINLLIDATHPFAQQISNSAVSAAENVGVARLRLQRPNWQMPENCDALFVPDMTEAAAIVARTARRVFLTIGVNELNAFADIPKVHFVIRMIDTPETMPRLNDFEIIYARPPFKIVDEEKLMREHDIDVLVTKASGGVATFAKIEAAANVGTRIILIRRPPPTDGDIVSGVAAALKWVEEKITLL